MIDFKLLLCNEMGSRLCRKLMTHCLPSSAFRHFNRLVVFQSPKSPYSPSLYQKHYFPSSAAAAQVAGCLPAEQTLSFNPWLSPSLALGFSSRRRHFRCWVCFP